MGFQVCIVQGIGVVGVLKWLLEGIYYRMICFFLAIRSRVILSRTVDEAQEIV